MNFKINSRPLFTIIFKLKNDNFKTRDFSPLIERVLAGVFHILFSESMYHYLSKNIVTSDYEKVYSIILDTIIKKEPPTTFSVLAPKIKVEDGIKKTH